MQGRKALFKLQSERIEEGKRMRSPVSLPTFWRVFRTTAVIAAIAVLGGPAWSAEIGMTPVTGTASFYGAGETLNDNTAMNVPFDARLLECASWEYPLGAVLEVTSLRSGKSVIVRCTDRGPAKRLNRIIDLTAYAFSMIDDPKHGLTPVRVRRLK
jgi:rare lipoprotein A